MKKVLRISLWLIFLVGFLLLLLIVFLFRYSFMWSDLLADWTFYPVIIMFIFSVEEIFRWVKNGARSELSDFVAILFFFFFIFFLSKDLLTSIMGAFAIYLWIGVIELKEYPVINKILIISLVTYNAIFVAGIISKFLGDPFLLNTVFAFSFWIILGLGFILFGRKYLVVWRFLSPEYLTLFLSIIAWLAVNLLTQYLPITTFINIYIMLILVNWVIYFVSGPILDKMLGIKKIDDENLLEIVEDVKQTMGIKGKIKVGFGKYPILNAMAYGAFFDKRIAIIAEDSSMIPEDELKGIIAHELAHTKKLHTLILILITTGDLIFRMIFGIPATYYDYTFGNPQMPLMAFIVLNFAIYIFLFIIVRILEGKADLYSKKKGYAKQLAKALYNLESFYATGREIGLNTMLLAEEKITNDNKLLDYFDTAKYLNSSMIRQSKGSLLSNIINSHPPTYYRLAAILGDNLKPGKEALLPFICLRKSIQKKYAEKFESARDIFQPMATEKFKKLFAINDVSTLMKDFGREEIYKYDINQDYIFKNKINDELLIGTLLATEFSDNIASPDNLVVLNLKNNTKLTLDSLLYSKSIVNIGSDYIMEKREIQTLESVEFGENDIDGTYNFKLKGNEYIKKKIKKTKIPRSLDTLKAFKNQTVFLKSKGELKILSCRDVLIKDDIKKSELVLTLENESEDKEPKNLTFDDVIIYPNDIALSINRRDLYRESEASIFTWLLKNQVRTYLYLKKPVNNIEVGYVKDLHVQKRLSSKEKKNQKTEDNNFIKIENIFNKEITIPYKSIQSISFNYSSGMIQKKAETSVFSKIGYRIYKKFKPQKIIYF